MSRNSDEIELWESDFEDDEKVKEDEDTGPRIPINIFFEIQQSRRCGQHAINNLIFNTLINEYPLIQAELRTKFHVDLNPKELALFDSGNETKPLRYKRKSDSQVIFNLQKACILFEENNERLIPGSSEGCDTQGDYDINLLLFCLQKINLNVTQRFGGVLRLEDFQTPNLLGFICNVIKPIVKYHFNCVIPIVLEGQSKYLLQDSLFEKDVQPVYYTFEELRHKLVDIDNLQNYLIVCFK